MIKVYQIHFQRKPVVISTNFGLYMLEERAWRQEMLEGNSAEELHELLKKAMDAALFNAATTVALCLIGHQDVTVEHHLFILANAGKMNGASLIQEAQKLIDKKAAE